MGPEDRDAVTQLKYAYFRHLDLKEFDELGALLTEDATAAYADGDRPLAGRAEIVEFLRGALSDPGIVSEHHGHHPEITFTGEDSATGVWYLQDRVVVPRHDVEIGGTAFYRDRYVRRHGRWLISHTGYVRVFEERRRHSTLSLISFSSRFDPA
ncbi:MAG TPA: nuclear transport factor 2 family protein [Acidimicrobiales bacterium]|nr:nuclear transport factor 2 family protein [Acidimicrobiales bacterium]